MTTQQQAKAVAIVGRNASGKTRYVERMRRQMASDRVRYIAFCDSYGAQTDRAYYLQQRWNQHDIDAETPTVRQRLERAFLLTGDDTPQRRHLQQRLYTQLGLEPLLDQYVISLSSGELRKLQLVKTLLAAPTTLLLDNPFIGLDSPTRQQLRDLLHQLVRDQAINIYMVLAREEEIPAWTDTVIRIDSAPDGSSPSPAASPLASLSSASLSSASGPAAPSASCSVCCDIIATPPPVVQLRDVTIRYGQRTILSHLDWTIREGECWSLTGRNGSGKSTLLSLISADNPQGYACDITLFGRRRGSGESIWDIKRRIGYVSPEMHRSYQRQLPAINVVASGLKDTVGLYVRPSAAEREQCRRWMRVFGVESLADRSFLAISSGEQRLVLLARAFVKSPDLLILDEPLHGLDEPNSLMVKTIINDYCQAPHKTLIMVTHYEQELPSCVTHHLTL